MFRPARRVNGRRHRIDGPKGPVPRRIEGDVGRCTARATRRRADPGHEIGDVLIRERIVGRHLQFAAAPHGRHEQAVLGLARHDRRPAIAAVGKRGPRVNAQPARLLVGPVTFRAVGNKDRPNLQLEKRLGVGPSRPASAHSAAAKSSPGPKQLRVRRLASPIRKAACGSGGIPAGRVEATIRVPLPGENCDARRTELPPFRRSRGGPDAHAAVWVAEATRGNRPQAPTASFAGSCCRLTPPPRRPCNVRLGQPRGMEVRSRVFGAAVAASGVRGSRRAKRRTNVKPSTGSAGASPLPNSPNSPRALITPNVGNPITS